MRNRRSAPIGAQMESGAALMVFDEQYVVDEQGNRTAVILDLASYQKVLEDLEELESISAYDAAKASGEQAVPLEQALAAIERHRN